MSKSNIVWLGRHEGWLKLVAQGVAKGEPWAIDKAAKIFDMMIPDQCVVMPMPSHNGKAEQMLDVVSRMYNLGFSERYYYNCLECDPHPSSHEQKRIGMIPSEISMRLINRGFPRLPIFIIDNVVATGTTAAAALKAVPDATVVSITYAPLRG